MIMSAYELNNFIFMAARLPQILSNYKVLAHKRSAHLCQAALFWFPTSATPIPLLHFPLGPQL